MWLAQSQQTDPHQDLKLQAVDEKILFFSIAWQADRGNSNMVKAISPDGLSGHPSILDSTAKTNTKMPPQPNLRPSRGKKKGSSRSPYCGPFFVRERDFLSNQSHPNWDYELQYPAQTAYVDGTYTCSIVHDSILANRGGFRTAFGRESAPSQSQPKLL